MIRRRTNHPGSSHPRNRSRWTPGLLVIKIKQDTMTGVPDLLRITRSALPMTTLPRSFARPFDWLIKNRRILEVTPLFADPAPLAPTRAINLISSFASSVRNVRDPDLAGINLVRLDPRADLDEEMHRLSQVPGVEYCHKLPRHRMAARRAPADPMLNRQWNLRAVHWFRAHSLPDASQIKVGILDTGIDTGHPDLPRVKTYRHSGESSVDLLGHGSHVAGILAARSNNSVGISGIANPALHIWKIFDDEPDEDDGDYYVDEENYRRVLSSVLRTGIQVLNLSISGEGTNPTDKMLFKKLVSAGVIVVAAMGNEYLEENPVEYPAAHEGVIAVGAMNEANRRATFSNTGPHITLSAPGVSILSTLPTRPSVARTEEEVNYIAWDGTSMATPHVAAAATLLLAKNPGMDPQEVTKRLQKTATRLPGAKREDVGAGLLNIRAALE